MVIIVLTKTILSAHAGLPNNLSRNSTTTNDSNNGVGTVRNSSSSSSTTTTTTNNDEQMIGLPHRDAAHRRPRADAAPAGEVLRQTSKQTNKQTS